MSKYDAIAKFYDSVVTDPSEKTEWLKQLITLYNPDAKNLLELACGTGSILSKLAEDYSVTGLDNSAGMLQIARGKLPNTKLVAADMSDFTLTEKYDAVLCIYDSINHLLDFTKWQSMFISVAQHMNPHGIFIFDMNTVEFLQRLNTSEPSISGFSENKMTIRAQPNPLAITTLKVDVTEKMADGTTQSHTTDIPEMSFSILTVQTELEKHFNILKKVSEQTFDDWQDSDNKIVFVCQIR